ncbi:hypothetical protein [Flaviaesturariibacter aridisoli]|uniref:Uncharacterized protein n=1 Tax=Flaviaesturariibacter aridisoli TaxID=2545761 RepID=A0A4V6P637_9BACT|nr:hypothetical protein [Flaviaesturariibacter aridisoli]TCZ64701.1 hypothetical protein E0486_17955 [Flaviaesturariibacter aridisoli]
MKRNRSSYTTAQKIGSVLLMIALLWLTVSIPFVYRFQQQQKAIKASIALEKSADDDSGNPLSNTNEEKCESGVSMPSEYLHEPLHIEHPSGALSLQYHSYEQDDFVAFHPEFITPPPDADRS